MPFYFIFTHRVQYPLFSAAIVVETADIPIISCNPGFSSSLLPAWGCQNTSRANRSTQMVWFNSFSKLYQSHRRNKKKKKACDRRSRNTVNWYCCLVSWFVCEFALCSQIPRLFPCSSDRNNSTSSSEEREVNQEEPGWNGVVAASSWAGFAPAPASPTTNNILCTELRL